MLSCRFKSQMKFFRKLNLCLRTLREKSLTTREIEISRVKKALFRHRKALDQMWREWATNSGICCPNCWSYGAYDELADKITRVERELTRLTKKDNDVKSIYENN